MTLMTKLYDNLLRINNQPLQLLYLMVMMIMVKMMTTTMSENVTNMKKLFFQITVIVVVLKYTSHGCSTDPRAISNKDNT